MKFYKDDDHFGCYFDKITVNKLTAIYHDYSGVMFFLNGKCHNAKNATYIFYDGYKEFYLDGKLYGDKRNFTKQTWRKFYKLKAFL
jgi:hypothetical protein